MIRSAVHGDAERLRAIYGYYVENTAVTYVDKVPSKEDFTRLIEQTRRCHPFLVLEEDGAVLGYCYASPFVDHPAFAHCCTLTIYLDHTARRRGYGRRLYGEMERRLRAMGITNLYACLGDPAEADDSRLTRDSEQFHKKLGFSRVGTMHRCGRKFGRMYNAVWMEKLLEI